MFHEVQMGTLTVFVNERPGIDPNWINSLDAEAPDTPYPAAEWNPPLTQVGLVEKVEIPTRTKKRFLKGLMSIIKMGVLLDR